MSDDLKVLDASEDMRRMVYENILRTAYRHFEEAEITKAGIRTAKDVLARQRYVREKFVELIGGLPERTPLKLRIMGVLDRPDYVVEKVIFESRPEFYVTANMYLPKRPKHPVPGILSPCGHSTNGKAYETYQRLYIGLAKKGYAVLSYDPLGQGERSQYWDEVEGGSRIGLSVPEHEYAGIQSLLVGINLASYRIWDGIRAMDYLISREEVDPDRIGCTGCSGGGTLTTYLAALDERIRAAVPVCYVTSRRRWLETGRIADAEQVQDGVIQYGIDHSDLCAAIAPRALLIGAAKRDYFPIEGTRETYQEVKQMYELLDARDRVALVEVDEPHGYSIGLRRAAYGWFNRWFGKTEEGAEEPESTSEEDSALRCVEAGQVHALHSRTVFCFTRDRARDLVPKRTVPTGADHVRSYQEEMRRKIADRLKYREEVFPVGVRTTGTVRSRRYLLEKIAYTSEPEVIVPALVFLPGASPPYSALVYVHESGKTTDAGHGGPIERLTDEGHLVLAIDLRGVGETESEDIIGGPNARLNVEGYHFYNYGMVGESLMGKRLVDVLRGVEYLRSRPDVDRNRVGVIGVGMGGVLALFAGALDTEIESVISERALISYRRIATSEYYDHRSNVFLPGALTAFDLDDVAACIAPRHLILRNSVDAMKRPMRAQDIEDAYRWTKEMYRALGAEDRVSFIGW